MSDIPPVLGGGRYEVGRGIGRGGMAEVHIGKDVRLGRTVAIKVLRADLARDPAFQARFRREAQSAASLNHPAIVAVYDTGEDVVNGLAVPFIVMEYVEGSTLRELLGSGRRLLPARAMEVTSAVLTALEYSHRQGIVHRDIKPGNVMLTADGAIKVMDFGIARALADTGAMTQTAAVMGTAQYLSPEQAKGEQVDARSDLYSTGCLFYELLTGRPPFMGDSPVAVAYQHVREEPQPPSSIDREVPPSADAIAMKALAKDREHRYQNAAEFRADLERAIAGHPVAPGTAAAATAAIPLVAAGASATQRVAPSSGYMPTPARGMPPVGGDYPEENSRGGTYWLALLLAVLAVAALGILLWVFVFGGEEDDPDAAGPGAGSPNPTAAVTMPDVVGQQRAAAETALRRQIPGVDISVTEEGSEEPEGEVLSTDPESGESVSPNGDVTLTVSGGQGEVTVPRLEGLTLDEAKQALAAQKLQFTVQRVLSARPADQVVKASRAEGAEVPANTTITLDVARGENTVPSVVGQRSEAAAQRLRLEGFDVEVEEVAGSADQAGKVIEQDPPAGTTHEVGDEVTIRVGAVTESSSTQTPPSTTPTPTEPTTATGTTTTPVP